MIYFWLVPLVLLVIVALFFFRKAGTKNGAVGRSSLDEARDE